MLSGVVYSITGKYKVFGKYSIAAAVNSAVRPNMSTGSPR